MFKYFLLRNHGGVGSNGTLLGTPIYNKFITTQSDFSTPRATFTESVSSAYADFAEALKNHIRFEERVVFPNYEEQLTLQQIEEIGKQLGEIHHKEEDQYPDEFWK